MAEASGIRSFWGLEIGPEARRRAGRVIASLRAGPGGGDVRWVREEALHVTLRFLGSIHPDRVPALIGEVTREVRPLAPFALALGDVDVFPVRRPRVVALGLEPAGPVTALAAAVERGVIAAGFPAEERAFRPHLTLGRARRDRRLRLDAESLQSVTASVTTPGDAWDVVDAVLFRSELSREGPRYSPLERVPLGAPGGSLHP